VPKINQKHLSQFPPGFLPVGTGKLQNKKTKKQKNKSGTKTPATHPLQVKR